LFEKLEWPTPGHHSGTSQYRFKPKDLPDGDGPSRSGRDAPADFRGKERSNATHAAPPILTLGSIARGRA